MEKNKRILNFVSASIILLLGAFILCAPVLKITDVKWLYRSFFITYSIISLVQFGLNFKRKDYTEFFSFIASISLLIASFIWNLVESPKALALSLMIWIMILALVKLKKADYYNDRHSRVWCIEIALMVLFLVAGVLTAINFANGTTTQILVLGYFVFICGITEVIDSLVLLLTNGKIR